MEKDDGLRGFIGVLAGILVGTGLWLAIIAAFLWLAGWL
jgi:hypothetical protein